MSQYLYGASVQGIQDFIFKTNKLQEIVGASEIVKGIEKLFEDNYNSEEVLINAAGNIKAVFGQEECQRIVLQFSKVVMQNAYGITLSQAVVKIEGQTPTQDEINQLEQRLKIQRNRVSIPLDLSLNIMQLNPSTSKPVVAYEKSSPIDRATKQKRKANDTFFSKNPHLKEFKDLSEMSNEKNKIDYIKSILFILSLYNFIFYPFYYSYYIRSSLLTYLKHIVLIYNKYLYCKLFFTFSAKNTNILPKHLTNRKIFAIIVV